MKKVVDWSFFFLVGHLMSKLNTNKKVVKLCYTNAEYVYRVPWCKVPLRYVGDIKSRG